MDAFEQRRYRGTAAALEVVLELAHHALHFGKHDRDCPRIGGGSDADRMVGLRGLHCDADQLPGGGKPAHHQDESVRQQVVHRGRIEHRLDRVEMGVGKVADVARQPIRDVRERVPRLEDPVEVAKVLERP